MQEQLIKHLNSDLNCYGYFVNVTDSFEQNCVVSIDDKDSITYSDWYYEEFNLSSLNNFITENKFEYNCEKHIIEEYNHLSGLLKDSLSRFIYDNDNQKFGKHDIWYDFIKCFEKYSNTKLKHYDNIIHNLKDKYDIIKK